ncbi:hypothetical protein DFH06DRAFT_1333727 [Mycena polygramma]|nr:hypothetical protein DFH06DRAFT_1333727 [Mycena polygramma]
MTAAPSYFPYTSPRSSQAHRGAGHAADRARPMDETTCNLRIRSNIPGRIHTFTPLGLTLLESLAHRGAHIILLRRTTANPNVQITQKHATSPPRPPSTRSPTRASSPAPTPRPPLHASRA